MTRRPFGKWMTALVLCLAVSAPAAEPALPAGLGGGESAAGKKTEALSETDGVLRRGDRLPFDLTGFADVRGGVWTRSNPHQSEDGPMAEARLQADAEKRWGGAGAKVVADFLYDGVADDQDIDLHLGKGWIDLRQANILFTPVEFSDVKIGRQILTWGTGDLLFINDNFPKDWVSFFIGRDVEYLKAPSDAAKASFFADAVNLDVVYTPQFDPDRYISGSRLSYFNAGTNAMVGEDGVVRTDRPDDWFADDEWAVRMYRNVGGYELALYGYDGFWKSPAGNNEEGEATFPKLSVYGGSVRGRVGRGIANLELGYKDSRDDPDGDDPFVRNSEWRLLTGYEQDLSALARDFTMGLQYYLEYMDHYDAYVLGLPEGTPVRDEDRHVVTLRLTKQLLQQNLNASLFTYYSPSDKDAYIRPNISYKVSDSLLILAGANIFLGSEEYTFFGQFEDNNNVYAGLRCSF